VEQISPQLATKICHNEAQCNGSPYLLQPHYKVTFPVSIGEMKLFDEVTNIET